MEKKKEKSISIKTLNDAKKAYENYLTSKEAEQLFKPIKDLTSGGENYLRQTRRIETKVFDDTFINEIDKGIGAIEKIISNPRTFIREEEELVEAGLANKITTLSIQHFASHTQFIRNIDEDGNVIPEKILTIFTETDTAIYENRFVMTLIKKLLTFVNTRYTYIQEHIQTFDSDLLQVHNKTMINGVTYEVDSRIKLSKNTDTPEEAERNKKLLDRLGEIRNTCQIFLHSRFMTEMKGAKDVSNPIHMTNMLRKHPDYHRAYLLWVFLDKYEELGISFDVKEYDKKFSKEYLNELSSYIASNVLLLANNEVDANLDSFDRHNEYNPEIIFSLEDETYADGKFIYNAYPDAYKKEILPLTSEEVRKANEKLKIDLANQKKAKLKVDELILEDKDKIVYEEVKNRKAREKILLDLIDKLEAENQELRKKLEDNEKMDLKNN